MSTEVISHTQSPCCCTNGGKRGDSVVCSCDLNLTWRPEVVGGHFVTGDLTGMVCPLPDSSWNVSKLTHNYVIYYAPITLVRKTTIVHLHTTQFMRMITSTNSGTVTLLFAYLCFAFFNIFSIRQTETAALKEPCSCIVASRFTDA